MTVSEEAAKKVSDALHSEGFNPSVLIHYFAILRKKLEVQPLAVRTANKMLKFFLDWPFHAKMKRDDQSDSILIGLATLVTEVESFVSSLPSDWNQVELPKELQDKFRQMISMEDFRRQLSSFLKSLGCVDITADHKVWTRMLVIYPMLVDSVCMREQAGQIVTAVSLEPPVVTEDGKAVGVEWRVTLFNGNVISLWHAIDKGAFLS